MKDGLWTKEEIAAANLKVATGMVKHNIKNSKWWAYRGLTAIFARQTADEQNIEATRYHNGIGFTGLDAQICSSFAKQIAEWNATPADRRRFASPLSPYQTEIAMRKMVKYAGQLVRITREKVAEAA
jgi:hypothetical protein